MAALKTSKFRLVREPCKYKACAENFWDRACCEPFEVKRMLNLEPDASVEAIAIAIVIFITEERSESFKAEACDEILKL